MADYVKNHRGYYTDGSAARVIEMPERDRVYNPDRRNTPDRKKKTKIKHRKKVSIKSALITVISIGLVFYMCIDYVMLYSDVLMTEKEISGLESEIADRQSENDEAYGSIDSSVDINEVYRIATKRLGMVHANASQVYTYKDKRSDRVIQYSDIPGEK